MAGLRMIISGGGTGGHIFPAIAIANEVKRRQPNAVILFIGALGKMEMEKVPQAGYEIKGLNIAGYQRGSILKNLALPFRIVMSLLSAYSVIKKFKPQVAVGVGGYASGPLLRVAGFASIPTVIQEQNSFAGITNKLLAKHVDVICTAYEGMENVFPKEKIVLTGNPIRNQLINLQIDKREAFKYFGLDENKKTLLIIGGSLGARTLNETVIASLEKIKASNVQIIWQTGKMYFEECSKIATHFFNLKALQFIDRMDYAYTCANVIISRAGASTISEFQVIGKPVILVPSPNVTEDHQTYNAMALVKHDAAILVKDAEAKQNLFDAAFKLLNDEQRQQTISANIKKMGITNAAERIVDEILKVAKT
jgi:UDP-N-acetylglucosamine--N-acetylmuramyl-(pentapeptide) pyrophosphoryl-undecaprenol N-acetylglucosamine transferase